MGCFLSCLGSVKDEKRQKQRKKVLPPDPNYGSQKSVQHIVCSEQKITEKPTNLNLELQSEEELSLCNRKKVAFDLNVKTYEHVSVHDSMDFVPESEKGIEKEEDSVVKPSLSSSLSDNGSVPSTTGSYPPNHRYQNCIDDDEIDGELEDEDSDLDDENEEEEEAEDCGDYNEHGDYRIGVEEGRSNSIPTTSMNSMTEIPSANGLMEEVESLVNLSGLPEQEVKTIGLKRNTRYRSGYVHSVLNPVENSSQWKAVKSQGTPPLKSEWCFKDSYSGFKSNSEQPKMLNPETVVDASLSNWLESSETTPTKKTSSIELESVAYEKSMSRGSNSVRSIDDEPIIGSSTVEELKQFSASTSSPGRSPEEMPIIGTVGAYWNHIDTAKECGSASSFKGIPNTTSKYKEDKRVNWHSTPFETRLERALNRGVSKA